MIDLQALRPLVKEHFSWKAWEQLIRTNGLTIDRPHGTAHPDYPAIIYPIDYGYVNGTRATDGKEVDVFAGSAKTGLVGTLLTTDHRRGDREFKLIFDSTPEEVYLAHGFVNFDRTLMEGVLVLRQPMRALWEARGVCVLPCYSKTYCPVRALPCLGSSKDPQAWELHSHRHFKLKGLVADRPP